MKCLQCQSENPERARFCLECGGALGAAAEAPAAPEQDNLTCPACEQEYRIGSRHCDQCGVVIHSARTVRLHEKTAKEARAAGRLGVAERELQALLTVFADNKGLDKLQQLRTTAERDLKQVHATPSQAVALVNKAQALESAADFESALEHLRQAAALDESHDGVLSVAEDRFPELIRGRNVDRRREMLGRITTWAETVAGEPDFSVVTSESCRNQIRAHGIPWWVRDKATGIDMLLVPAGTYMRGSSASDDEADDSERPEHQVTISKPFYLGRYPVTQAQWKKVMGDSPTAFRRDKSPVEYVSWNEIQPFLKRTGLRLPTEAEWEYACRAGTTEPRYGELDAIAWHDGNAEGEPHDVGGKVANPWAFHDMIGNMWEWCADGWDEKAYQKCGGGVTDPVVAVGSSHVLRGGSWHGRFDMGVWRSANRDGRATARREAQRVDRDDAGFRVARAP